MRERLKVENGKEPHAQSPAKAACGLTAGQKCVEFTSLLIERRGGHNDQCSLQQIFLGYMTVLILILSDAPQMISMLPSSNHVCKPEAKAN